MVFLGLGLDITISLLTSLVTGSAAKDSLRRRIINKESLFSFLTSRPILFVVIIIIYFVSGTIHSFYIT